MDWQPIETAPRDGTWMLGYWTHLEGPDECSMSTVRFSDGCFEDDQHEGVNPPTHWMPLPAPPRETPEQP